MCLKGDCQFTSRTFATMMFIVDDRVLDKRNLTSDINKRPYFIVNKEGGSSTDKKYSFYRYIKHEKETPYIRESSGISVGINGKQREIRKKKVCIK